MIKEMLVFAGAFAICAAVGATGSGCSSEEGTCKEVPDGLPSAQRALRIDNVRVDRDASNAISLTGSTIEGTGGTVVVRYEQDGLHHEIAYTVHPHMGGF